MESNIDKRVLEIIRFAVLRLETGNAKTHEKTDADMVGEIVKIIKKEVDRISQ